MRNCLVMKRRPDTEAPAILLNEVLNEAIRHRVSVSRSEDIVYAGAQVESAEGPGRKEREVGKYVTAGDVSEECGSCAHVLRIHRGRRGRAEDRRPQLHLD